MNNILTNSISEPNVLQPFTGPSLKFLQNATSEMLEGLVAGLSSVAYTNGAPIALYGMQKVLISGNNYQFGNGYVFLNNEICIYSGTSSISITQHPILKVTNVNDPTVGQITFTDGTPRFVCMIRRLSLTDGALNSGDANYDDLVFTNEDWNVVGTIGQPAFQNSWANVNSGTTNPASFKMDGQFLELAGYVYAGASGTTVFTLPASHRPSRASWFVGYRYDTPTTGEVCNINVNTSGNVDIYFKGGTNNGMSMDGIRCKL